MSDTDIRKWALANGRKVSARGPISEDLRVEYAEQSGTPLDLEQLEPSDADFPADVSEAGPPPADQERRPRAVAVTKAPRFGFGRGKQATAADKKKAASRKRIPVDDFIAGAWRGLAGFCKPLPATSRLLKIQAPVAGLILEDTVRNTTVDKWLQPLARAQQSGTAMFALAGPPILVTALQLQPQSAPFILPVLRESLLAWCKVAGPKMADALKREREFEDQFGGNVDEILAFILADMIPDAPGMTPEEEEERVRATQEAMQNAGAAA